MTDTPNDALALAEDLQDRARFRLASHCDETCIFDGKTARARAAVVAHALDVIYADEGIIRELLSLVQQQAAELERLSEALRERDRMSADIETQMDGEIERLRADAAIAVWARENAPNAYRALASIHRAAIDAARAEQP